MATYTGDATIVAAARYYNDFGGGSGALYTVPAGHFAFVRVWDITIDGAGWLDVGEIRVVSATGQGYGEIMIDEGETAFLFNNGGGGVRGAVHVITYKKP